jgi:hypothetical protein
VLHVGSLPLFDIVRRHRRVIVHLFRVPLFELLLGALTVELPYRRPQ